MDKDLHLNRIYDRTDGYCHICHKKLSFKNYGKKGAKGCWEIEHSIPRACGGTDHLNNLFPACISCNRDKGTISSRTIRKCYGTTRAPLSSSKKQKIKEDNTAYGMLFGGLVGLLGGPMGVLVGVAFGGWIGHDSSPRI